MCKIYTLDEEGSKEIRGKLSLEGSGISELEEEGQKEPTEETNGVWMVQRSSRDTICSLCGPRLWRPRVTGQPKRLKLP